jgi:hypothetical protein
MPNNPASSADLGPQNTGLTTLLRAHLKKILALKRLRILICHDQVQKKSCVRVTRTKEENRNKRRYPARFFCRMPLQTISKLFWTASSRS